MRYFLLLTLMVLFVSTGSAQIVVQTFDSVVADTAAIIESEGNPTRVDLTDNATDFVEGAAALQADAMIGAFHQWGSFAAIVFDADEGVYWDWTSRDTLSLWLKVVEAPTLPENMTFRITLEDRLNDDGDPERYVYQNNLILDTAQGWVNLKAPFYERETDGTVGPNDSGFVLQPDNWGGATNNRELDFDKIVSYEFNIVTEGWVDSGNLPADSVVVLFDEFALTGSRAFPVVFFNGMTLSNNLSGFGGWNGSNVAVEEGAGFTEGTNALRWDTGSAWTGFTFELENTVDMSGSWGKDSLKFKIKAPAETGDFRVFFDDGQDPAKKVFYSLPAASMNHDNTWKEIAIPLMDINIPDGDAGFDSTQVKRLSFMMEGEVTPVRIYLDDIWTGNPDFDVIPPEPVTGVNAAPGDYYNLVIWQDVPNESGEIYKVFASPEPITDLQADEVEIVSLAVEEDLQSVVHYITYPLEDNEVTWYYAVVCVDEAGNESPFVATSAMTNVAKGIPTISLNVPEGSTVDNSMDEWLNSDIMPFVINKSTAHINAAGQFDDDDDLNGEVYLAIDEDYLYVAADVIDNVYSFDPANFWYLNDAMEIFIGLYDSRGRKHASLESGSEPDYKLVFTKEKMFTENTRFADLSEPGTDHYYFEEFGGADYYIEAQIPLDSLVFGDENERFHPIRGMRIAMDIVFHDNDGNGHEGDIGFSKYNDGNAWQSVMYWDYTWIGDIPEMETNVETSQNSMIQSYRLEQNYPNPFNPTTNIRYTLAHETHVKLEIFNVLGQKMMTLVEKNQSAGSHTVQFDAKGFASGVYFYQLTAGDFKQIRKMMLFK